MVNLLEEVHNISPEAADVLRHTGLQSNTELRSLSREDLHELFPGVQHLQLRKKIFGTIHKLGAKEELLKELADMMHGGLNHARSCPEYMDEYTEFVRTVKKQVYVVEKCLDCKIDIMKSAPYRPVEPEAAKEQPGIRQAASRCFEYVKAKVNIEGLSMPAFGVGHSLTPKDSFKVTVKYKMVVSGQTFNAHEQLMNKVKNNDKVCFVENPEGSQITIVFCPVTSRIPSDVDSAMTGVTDDKPVLLVLMHHQIQPQSALSRMRPVERDNIVRQVVVFYHQTECGLLKCEANDKAVSLIQRELQKLTHHETSDDMSVDEVNPPK